MKRRRSALAASGRRLGNSPPSSIDPTGAANVSSSLQAWIDAQPDFSTINLTGKTYRIDQQLTLTNRNNLTFTGGTLFTDAPTPDGSPIDTTAPYDVQSRTRSQFKLVGCADLTFTGMTIRGANPNGGQTDAAYEIALEAQMAFWISNCDRIDIGNCLMSDMYGDFVYMADGSTYVTVHDNTCTRNGRQSFAIVNSSHIIIRDNTVYDCRRAFIDIEPNGVSDVCTDILIDSNDVGPHRLLTFTAGGSGIVSDVRFTNNTLTGNEPLQVSVSASGPRSNFLIENNTAQAAFGSSGTPAVAMTFSNVAGIIVRGNTCPVDDWRPCAIAGFTNCTGIEVTGNTITGGSQVLKDNGGNTIVANCGNRLTASGAFDQPSVCP